MLRFAEVEDDRNKVVSALARLEARSAISRLRKENRMTPAESIVLLDTLADEARRMIEQPINPPVLEAATTQLIATIFVRLMPSNLEVPSSHAT